VAAGLAAIRRSDAARLPIELNVHREDFDRVKFSNTAPPTVVEVPPSCFFTKGDQLVEFAGVATLKHSPQGLLDLLHSVHYPVLIKIKAASSNTSTLPVFSPSNIVLDCSGPTLPNAVISVANPSASQFMSYRVEIRGAGDFFSVISDVGVIPPTESVNLKFELNVLVTRELLASTPRLKEPCAIVFALLDEVRANVFTASDNSTSSVYLDFDYQFEPRQVVASGARDAAATASCSDSSKVAAMPTLQGIFFAGVVSELIRLCRTSFFLLFICPNQVG
jgi:hypothetical protein